MKQEKKLRTRLLSLFMAMLLMLTALPFTAMTASAAPASDIPEEMLDNAILRALAYTGYDVEAQMEKGTLYQSGHYGSSLTKNDPDILSNISYGTSTSGRETVADSTTITGLAPDIAKFEDRGLCCASFVSYFICNYLPNIEGADTQFITDAILATGMNSQACVTWQVALERLVNQGKIEKVGTSTSNVDYNKMAPGDLIIFGNDTSSHAHIAVYAGTYKGKAMLIHVGNERGPEISRVDWMGDASNGDKASFPNGFYHLPSEIFEQRGAIEVKKVDENGKALAGAEFIAVSTTNPSVVFSIGPTDSNGYATTGDTVPFDTYRVYESVFPDSFQSSGVSEWTVTLNKDTPNGTITINAVNEKIPGTCRIVKTSEDGVVDGISFKIEGNGVSETRKTANGGVISLSLKPGVYTVTEEVLDSYNPQTAQTVTVVSGQTATVNFDNTLRRGSLKIKKTAEDDVLVGHRFKLTGTSLAGIAVEMYAVTDSDGIAVFENIPISGTEPFVIEEINTAQRYVVPDSQEVNILWNETTEVTFHNVLKKFRVEVLKADRDLYYGYDYDEEEGIEPEKMVPMSLMSVDSDAAVDYAGYPFGIAQGDATLKGHTYGLYDGKALLATYVTDENGYFITDYFPCGDVDEHNYYIREIRVAENGGYLLDDTTYYLDIDCRDYTVELNSEELAVLEYVIIGKISLIKHSDDGSTQIETPEAGAEFKVYLRSAGSYENAGDNERDYLICDENGFAETHWLPYGVYVVSQVKSGKDGTELLPDFEVFISEEGRVYRYLANNALFESYVRIVKVDAETGNTIPCANVGFQLYTPDGEQIKMTYTYPQVTVIDTFYTNSEGFLVTPEPLEYGTGYYLVEVSAPDSYVLDSDPVYFDIIPEIATDDNGVKIIEVVKTNMPQKGIIKINKKGEVFTSVTESEGIYQPVYSVKGLEGAVFDIIAAEDIYSGGVLRYAEGDVVETVTTGADGSAATGHLYLGKFRVVEQKASHGTVLNTTPIDVELVYAGQTVEITETFTEIYNERQKAVVSLKKQMEQNELFALGNNGEITAVSFGLYAKETLVAADGSEIPAGGLLEIAACDAEGNITFTTDIPVGAVLYIKEYTTDSHYKLSDKEYPVTFDYADQTVSLVEITVNDGEPISNELIYGSVSGLKKDEDGNVLAGAVFGLFAEDTKEFTEETAIMSAISGEDGRFVFEKIPAKSYIVRELDTGSPAFVLNDTLYPVTVTEDGQVIEIEVENRYVKGSVKVVKVDRDNPETKLTGAVFEIYKDTNDNEVFDADTDELIGTMSETEIGVYRMDELRYGGYFLFESAAPELFNADGVYHYFRIETDSEVKTVENSEGVGFVNAPKVGSLKIVKTSSDGKVEGFSFRITSTNGYDEVFVTDENGEIFIENLRIGSEYLVSEISNEANADYVLPEDKTVTITEGTVTEIEMHNERKPEPEVPDSPQTGDNSNILLYALLMLASGSALVILLITSKKLKRTE